MDEISIFRENPLFYFFSVACIAAFLLLIWGWSKIPKDIPPGPFGLPLIGSLLQLGDSPHLALSKMAKDYGKVFSIRLGWRKAIVLNSQDVVKEALSKRAGHFSGRPPFHSFKISPHQSESIAFGDFGPSHQKKKKMAIRALHSVFTDVNRFNSLSHQEFERMRCNLLTDGSSEAQDLTPHLKSMVISFAFRFVFGDNFEEDYSAALQSLLKKAADFTENNGAINLIDFFPWLHFLFKKQCQTLKDSVRELFDFVRSIYTLQRHASIKEAGVNVAASLDQIIREDLVNAGKPDPKTSKSTEQKARSESLEDLAVTVLADVFGAGIETVSTSLSWALLYILSKPGLQDDLQAELKRVIGVNRLPSLQDRAKLPLLHATVLEVLRMATVLPLSIPHYTTEDSEVAGYRVPKGTTVVVNLWAVNHDPQYFDHPEVFNPHRFLDTEGQLLLDQQAFLLPFSTGGRRCPGATLAKAQLFMFLGCLLQGLHLQLPEHSVPLNMDGEFGFVLKPRSLKVQVNPRNIEQ